MHYYLFNPEHDLALANGSATFYAPAAIQKMAYDLSLLPLWYAKDNSRILTTNIHAKEYFEEVREVFPYLKEHSINITDINTFQQKTISASTDDCIPWGWDKSIREHLCRLGFSKHILPSDKYLDAIRWLSNRRRAMEISSRLQLNEHYIGDAKYLTDISSCHDFTKQYSASVFKAPLSGSGKGLLWYRDGIFTSPFERWCNRQLTQQGGVVAEQAYEKLCDIAAEFYISDDGKTTFAGFSFFNTSKTGVYQQNLLVPNTYKNDTNYMRRITDELIPQLQNEIQKLFGTCYQGYIGVDMMVCRSPKDVSEIVVHPCVEINTRMTMGIASRLFYDHFISPESTGFFRIDYYKKENEAYFHHMERRENHPAIVKKGKIEKGYLSLTPVDKQTHVQAWVEINHIDY